VTSLFEKLQIPTVEETDVSEVTEVIPTNIIPLDIALGIGGFPRGRLSAIVGAYSTGKSSIGVILARNNLRLGGKTLIIDTEFTYEKFRLTQFNVPINSKDIAVLQNWKGDVLTAEKTEAVLITTLKVAKPEDKLLIIWDTISSTPLEAELTDREDKDKLMGRHSRILSRLLRTIPKDIAEKNVTIVMIVQPKIDPMTGTTTYLGEKPIKFHSSILVNLSRYSKDESKMVVGFDIQKNKCAPPFTKGKFTFYLHSGIDYISGWDAAVGKATAFYQLGDVSVKRTESGLLLLKKKTLVETIVTEKLFRRIPYRVLLEENDVYAYRPTTNGIDEIEEDVDDTAEENVEQ